MRFENRRENSTAFAVVAAIVGAGFASGREISTFFTCTGWASWLGILCASSLLGLLTAVLAALAQRDNVFSFPGLYRSVMGRECGDAIEFLHGTTMVVTASVMLSAAGELGALAINLHCAYALSLLLSLITGILLSRNHFSLLRTIAAILVPLISIYYTCLALDPTPVPRQFLAFEDSFGLSGNVVAACLLAALYAALNTAMSGGVLTSLAHGGIRPRRLGLKIGLLLLALLVPANAALLRAGTSVRRMALPSVVLAARWGKAGFYLSAFVTWLSVVTTLAASLGSLRGQAEAHGLRPGLAVPAASFAALCLSAVGFTPLVRVGYPLLGWICAMSLLGLIPFLKYDPVPESHK